MTGRILWCLASLVLAAMASSDTQYLTAQQGIVLPDGRRINVYCTGRGSPAVMLEGGWTTETSYWRKVQPLIAKRSRVCSYDRAGYGFSDPGPMPRSAAAIAHDFGELVNALRGRDSFILVAHSLGSFPARLYAYHHPERVAALILLDPPSEDDRLLAATLGPRFDPAAFVDAAIACSSAVIDNPSATPEAATCLSSPSPTMTTRFNEMRSAMQRTAPYQRTAASELREMYGRSSDQVRHSRRWLGDMPLIVLTAEDGSTDPSNSARENAAVRQVQWRAQARIASLSSRSVHRLLPAASHFIPMKRPQEVVKAVDEARAMLTASKR